MLNKVFIVLILLLIGFVLGAAVPNMIPIQGTLTDSEGNIIDDDAAEVSFAIYDAETDGTELWHETRTLLIDQGKLSVYLGEIEPITYEKIGGKDALWLEIGYDGEVMNRIRLASVPFAMEAAVAHNAEQVGKYSEQRLDDMLASACDEGSFLRGWSGSTPICELDKEGEGGTGSYTAGKGIVINGKEIAVEESLFFQAGDGIEIVDGTISVNGTRYALVNHNHDLRYYRRNEDIVHEHDMTVNGLFVAGSDATVNGDLTVEQNIDMAGDLTVHKNADISGSVTARKGLRVKGENLNVEKDFKLYQSLFVYDDLSHHNRKLTIDQNYIDANGSLFLNNGNSGTVVVGNSSSPHNNLLVYGNTSNYSSNWESSSALTISTGSNQKYLLLDDHNIDSTRDALNLNKQSKKEVHVGGLLVAEEGMTVQNEDLRVQKDIDISGDIWLKNTLQPIVESGAKVISTLWDKDGTEKLFKVRVWGPTHVTDKSVVNVNVCEAVSSSDPTCKYGNAKDDLIVTGQSIYKDGSIYYIRLRVRKYYHTQTINIAARYIVTTPQ